MDITYYVPTTWQNKEELCTLVRHLFQVEPQVVNRMTERIESGALVQQPTIQAVRPHVVFTLSEPGTLSSAQRAFVRRPGVEVERKYGPGEVLYECIRDKTSHEA